MKLVAPEIPIYATLEHRRHHVALASTQKTTLLIKCLIMRQNLEITYLEPVIKLCPD